MIVTTKMKNQQGNVIFIILIAVILFAALGFAVTDMVSKEGSVQQIGDQKRAILVNEVLGYGNVLRQAAQNMRINGCEEAQISFEKSPFDGTDATYVNGSAPGNFSCNMFHPSGGGVTYVPPTTELLSVTDSAQPLYGEWYFSGNDSVDGLGSGSEELIAFLPWMNQLMCEQVNKGLDIAAQSENWTFDTGNKFTGSYGSSGEQIGATANNFDNRSSGCVEDTAGNYFFYQVVIAR